MPAFIITSHTHWSLNRLISCWSLCHMTRLLYRLTLRNLLLCTCLPYFLLLLRQNVCGLEVGWLHWLHVYLRGVILCMFSCSQQNMKLFLNQKLTLHASEVSSCVQLPLLLFPLFSLFNLLSFYILLISHVQITCFSWVMAGVTKKKKKERSTKRSTSKSAKVSKKN